MENPGNDSDCYAHRVRSFASRLLCQAFGFIRRHEGLTERTLA